MLSDLFSNSCVAACQTAVDDPIDEDRVNCVLTSLLAAEGLTPDDAEIKEEGVSQDLDVASIVSVSHAVRFMKPSVGIEIVVRCVSHHVCNS